MEKVGERFADSTVLTELMYEAYTYADVEERNTVSEEEDVHGNVEISGLPIGEEFPGIPDFSSCNSSIIRYYHFRSLSLL